LVKLGKTKYFGSPLTIRSIPSRSVGPRMELFPVFREALKPLYQAQARLLNLRQLHSVVHEQNSALSHPGALLALLLVVVEAYPSVKSLDLSDNGISSLAPFKDVLLPELANICLENNRISSFSELDHLKALRVQNLILLGNPLHHKEPMEYKSEVLRRFPALRWLDRGQVAPVMPLPVELASACSFPKLKGNFCGVPGRQAEVARFLKTYFDKFDSNRNDLFTVYTDKSYFSCSTVADVQHSDAKHPQQGSGGKGEPRLNRYGLFSRNLLEVSKFEQRQKSIARGRLDVIHVIKSLPETAHDIATFTLDCYPVPTMTPSLLVITVNGKFWEAQAKVNRNFTRTFVITEGGASHPMILNDELNVRKYKEHKPSGMPAAGTAASSSVSDPGPFSGSFFSSDGPSCSSSQSEFLHLSQRQVDLLNKYRTINSCDMQTAFNALSRNNWDYNRALTSGFREELM
ncbi:MAG: leucine-rich repeat protein, partial [archaeon]|nr:leucine-rich repeat protein [archaeon]